MRRAFGILTLVAVLTALPPAVAADEAHSIDVKLSHATFSVGHVLVERVTGSVPIVSAQVTVGPNGVIPSMVTATLDARHIDTGDSDRDGDLTGSDWFDTKAFPVWTFTSTRIEPKSGDSFAVAGSLTIHGVTVPVTLSAAVVRGAPHPAYHATTTVDRHAFGMVVTRTDALVGNAVSIILDVQTK